MDIIIDCDPGHDDAIALLLLGSKKYFNVLGVTTTAGNQTIEKTTNNALNIISYLNLNYKVYKGIGKPLKREVVICDAIHGESGLDGFDFPKHNLKCEEKDAINFMVDAINFNKEKVTVITTGPMTNLARAYLKDNNISKNIEKIVLMGGSIGAGNVTPAAEFNINCDAEAADICFKMGVPIYMVGLDVTRKVLVTKDIIERMKKINNKASIMFACLMETFNINQKKVFNLDGGPLHDPVTVASLIDENLVKFEYVNTEIDTCSSSSYGRTNCDIPNYLKKEKNSYVATSINVERFFDIIEEAIKSYK